MPRIDRRTFLFTVTGAAAACSRAGSGSSLARAAAYLWGRQAADGGFHSSTYGLLRSGQSLTPFALDALLDVPVEVFAAPAGAVDRALAFIKTNTAPNGALGQMDETVADYPNYATALAVSVMAKARPKDLNRDVAPMVAYLRSQQFAEENGWTSKDAPYGAWGMGGPIHRPPSAGHVDLSMTRYVMEALRAAGVGAADPAMTRALTYLERLQNSDGGFYFSAVNTETNKAGETDGHFASYGTTTADGLLALRATGLPDTDVRIAKAAAWLKNHHQPDRVPGFAEDSPRQSWATGLRFYYAAAISRSIPALPVTLPPQEPDGAFRNSNNLVKEDDPLIATPFAIRALMK